MRRKIILVVGFGFLLNLHACGPKEKIEPVPCKLLYYSALSNTYEYNEKNQLIRFADPSSSGNTFTYNYDENGYLLARVTSNGDRNKYEYANGLLIKETYGNNSSTVDYGYNNQNRLVKKILRYGANTETTMYQNGKIISVIVNQNGTTSQPAIYENGKVIRRNFDNGSYTTYEYDSKGRTVRFNDYNASGLLTYYTESSYQENGTDHWNASPQNFFKGFPDEIKNIKPSGLSTKSTSYRLVNNTFVRSYETTSTYVLNSKGYPTSHTYVSSSRNSAGAWITNSPYTITFAYINCGE